MFGSLAPILVFEATATASFQFVCVCLVSLFIAFCCIPSIHTPVRQLVRPTVIIFVENGLDWVVFLQQYKRPWLTKLFEQSSHSVSGSFLPCVIWLGFPELGWHLVVLMTLTLYVGNAMKDLVSAPRPLGVSYGKARLSFLAKGSEEQNINAKEYGLPSSHTMNSLCLNFYAVHYLHEQKVIGDSITVNLYALVSLWVIWIALSRVYLGFHTPVDIAAGAVAGLTVVTTFISLENMFNAWVIKAPIVVLLTAGVASLILLRLHPKPLNPTPTFEFSTSFMGVMFGVVIGVSRFPSFFQPAVSIYQILDGSKLTVPVWFWILRRLFAGFTIVLASKEISRAVTFALLPRFYIIFPLALRKRWQPPVHNQCPKNKIVNPLLIGLPHTRHGLPWDVDVTSRFFAYAGIGFAVCEMAPRLFAALDW
ncbi:hypothetical protein KSW81_003071 [Nannochloris sp. 'desiccata']|nr:hypothetical protein KSW81_003071 [Chlorella desiccata (nom. nud.)]